MKQPTPLHLLGAVLALAVGCERAPDPSVRAETVVPAPAAAPRPHTLVLPGSFAYVDSSGTRLLTPDSLPDPATILGAVCAGGVVLPVRSEGWQPGRPEEDDGRQWADNFDKDRGHVFRVTRGNAPPDGSCYLSPDSALLSHARTVTTLDPSECAPDRTSRVAAARQREVVQCWDIGGAPEGEDVLAVEFVTVDTSALASLVVVKGDALLFNDFPAVYEGPGESLWRVDDGGEFFPEAFEILFVAPLPNAYMMAFVWHGAEGAFEQLLLADSAGAFRAVGEGYRYLAPR